MSKKKRIPWKFLGGSTLLIGGFFLAQNLINIYWLPPEARQFLSSHKFPEGSCIKASKIWGVETKKVIALKLKQGEQYYLLKDEDRHEHLQLLKKHVVERHAIKISCGVD